MIYLNAIGKNKDFQKNCQIVPNYKKIHKQPYFLEIFVAKKERHYFSRSMFIFRSSHVRYFHHRKIQKHFPIHYSQLNGQVQRRPVSM